MRHLVYRQELHLKGSILLEKMGKYTRRPQRALDAGSGGLKNRAGTEASSYGPEIKVPQSKTNRFRGWQGGWLACLEVPTMFQDLEFLYAYSHDPLVREGIRNEDEDNTFAMGRAPH